LTLLIKKYHSQASFESKLLRAMANA